MPRKQVKEKNKKESYTLSNEQYLELYYYMRLTREFEESILKLYRQGKIIAESTIKSGFPNCG